MMRRHLSSETWGVVIKAAEELRAPLRPLLEKLGVSRSSYYRKRGEYLAGGIAGMSQVSTITAGCLPF